MRGVFAITMLVAIAIAPLGLEGQMRGARPSASRPMGGFHGSFGGRAGPVGRPAFGGFAGPTAFHHPTGFNGFVGFHNGFFFPHQFHHRFPFIQPWIIYYPYYPIYSSPYYGGFYGGSYYQASDEQPATSGNVDYQLGAEIGSLKEEVARLRDEITAREQARPPAPQTRSYVEEEKPPTTTLVFRDGHRSEIQNYAIVGQTLWVFTEARAKKIPISELNIEATKNVNAARGVEVRFP
jgi:hypothetical protein